MYVTRSLSHYKSFPEALYSRPDGPNSGYLVIQDTESETYSCFGLCKNRYLAQLPFPQNKILTTRYSSGGGQNKHVSFDKVVFIPVLDQPLSSNRYYVIKPHGSHKGEAYACSTEEDMRECCLFNCVRDVKPRPFDPNDVHQQFEIVRYEALCRGDGSFFAKSITEDCYPPHFLRRKGWEIYSKTPKNFELQEAKGIDVSLRSRLPDMNFSPSAKTSNRVVVGKWYCPFIFIKEGRLADQVKRSMYYEMTLEQRWEQVFEQENEHNIEGNVVSVTAALHSEAAFVGDRQREALWDEVENEIIWFHCQGGDRENEESVGLNVKIIERMRWEEEKVGWGGVKEKRLERVKRDEKYEGSGGWRRFGCYVLIERFVLKRMDGSLVLSYDFAHTQQIRSIFE